MSDLWAERRAAAQAKAAPLASRMRPQSLDEVAGQTHVLGEGKLLRRMLIADAIMSLILHGPPGTGKTTLARLIAEHTKRPFVAENAASVGVKRIREVIDDSARRVEGGGRGTILFLDEIHRFTRSQQDVLLGDVERGLVTLVGATTENPLFACNAALVSRSTLFRLEPLCEDDIIGVLRRAIEDGDRGFGSLSIEASDEALRVWAVKCDGDARRALTALEVAVLSADGAGASAPIAIDRAVAEESIQQKAAMYADDEHYDAASAMIKSIRGSDPDAAVYWIARMLEGGEDPRFVARRLAILASEDIGNADPHAAVLAASCWQLVERIGMPEARITLGQLATYLSLAPKSNASYVAIDAAMADVREGRTVPVPVHLRDPNTSPTAGSDGAGLTMRQRRAGDAAARYRYSHDAEGGVTGQDYLGVEKSYYEPSDAGAERAMAARLKEIKALRQKLRDGEG
ncbi:MAG: replication-associated recombination protein A [Planctomycetota bacterium]